MAHLTVNGVAIPGAADSFEEKPEYIGEVAARGSTGAFLESRAARMRTWSVKTVFQLASIGEALRKLIEGEGHAWAFTSNTYSSKGVAPASGGSYSRTGSGGKHGGTVAVSAASAITFALATKLGVPRGWDPSLGWTVIAWADLGAGLRQYIATGAVAVPRGAAADPVGVTQYENGVAGSYGLGNLLSIEADGDFGLHGYNTAGAATAISYSDLVVLPFEVPASWVPGVYAFHAARAWPALPRVTIDGDALEDGPIDCIGRVTRTQQRNVVLSGAHRNNARVLEVSFMEAGQ